MTAPRTIDPEAPSIMDLVLAAVMAEPGSTAADICAELAEYGVRTSSSVTSRACSVHVARGAMVRQLQLRTGAPPIYCYRPVLTPDPE